MAWRSGAPIAMTGAPPRQCDEILHLRRRRDGRRADAATGSQADGVYCVRPDAIPTKRGQPLADLGLLASL
jgi:hypothetical protein